MTWGRGAAGEAGRLRTPTSGEPDVLGPSCAPGISGAELTQELKGTS